MNLELRILAGLHRGACIPVQADEDLRIGSDEACDVVLVDADWTALMASLRLGADGWSLAADGAEAADTLRGWGQTIDLAGVRFTVCDSTDPWSFEAREPAAPDTAELSAADDQALLEERLTDLAALEAAQALEASPLAPDAPAAPATPDAPAEPAAAIDPARRPARRKGLGRGAISLMGVAIIGLAGYSLASAYAPDRAPDRTADRALDRRAAGARDPQLPGPADAALAATPAASAAALSEDELRQRFTERLKEAELLPYVDTLLTGPRWTVQGNLGPDEAQRLERVIVGFIRQHRPAASIQAKILSAEELLPFKIQQITSGANASVVTADGRRFYVGDGDGGYTLAKVDANAVVFTGKRRIEVLW